MGCNLTSNLKRTTCEYQIAGVKSVYLINYEDAPASAWTIGINGEITEISLINSGFAYKIDQLDNSASFMDDLAVNGNGGKYRTHTANFTIGEYDYNILNQGDALSLGRFVIVMVDKSGRGVVLGRTNGLTATSFNYASGAADADANGWTTVFTGSESEIAKLLADETVITSIVSPTVVVP